MGFLALIAVLMLLFCPVETIELTIAIAVIGFVIMMFVGMCTG